jgi:hypothetical protein
MPMKTKLFPSRWQIFSFNRQFIKRGHYGKWFKNLILSIWRINMETKDAQTIVNEIYAHMQKQGGKTTGWYVGIAADIDQRLFTDHKVPRQNHWFIYRKSTSANNARTVEKALLDLGCDGGGGGGDDKSVYVYAYLKGPNTEP